MKDDNNNKNESELEFFIAGMIIMLIWVAGAIYLIMTS